MFDIIVDEIRLTILEALWESPDRPIPFSEPRRRAGIDGNARFDYYFGKPCDQFIHETDKGYDFRHISGRVIRAMLAETFNKDPIPSASSAPGSRVICGNSLKADCGDGKLAISYAGCTWVYARGEFPPGGLEGRSSEALLSALDQHVRHLHYLAIGGVYPECSGTTSTALSRDANPFDLRVIVTHRCVQYAHETVSSVGLVLPGESMVLGLLSSRDRDVCGMSFWRSPWIIGSEALTVIPEESWHIRVRTDTNDEHLIVELDGDLPVAGSAVESAEQVT